MFEDIIIAVERTRTDAIRRITLRMALANGDEYDIDSLNRKWEAGQWDHHEEIKRAAA